MLLSIIVPTYNVAQYLPKCLDSLLQQNITAEDYEIIVINDGSTDSSLAIAENYAETHANIKVITQENQGLSSARNTGILQVQGKYLFFVDSDDYIEMDCLKELLQYAEENDLEALRFNYRRVYENGKIAEEEKIHSQNQTIKTGKKFLTEDVGLFCYVPLYLFKTDVIKQNLFQTGIYFEDVEWLPRVLLQINRIGYFDKLVYHYLQRTGSITLSVDIVKKEKIFRDKLIVIDSILAIKNRDRKDKEIDRWAKRILSLSVVSIIAGVACDFYSQRKYYIDELKCRDLFPLSFYSTKKLKFIYKVILINISQELFCWLVGKRWKKR